MSIVFCFFNETKLLFIHLTDAVMYLLQAFKLMNENCLH